MGVVKTRVVDARAHERPERAGFFKKLVIDKHRGRHLPDGGAHLAGQGLGAAGKRGIVNLQDDVMPGRDAERQLHIPLVADFTGV